ncbi:MAG: hypothetical protein FJX73_10700 [Armatimonadetes bacterium]|nr:hypothetical protein [Armatimonadota bacterium]
MTHSGIAKYETALAAAVVILAAGLRLWGLTAKSLWFDETISVFLAAQPLERLLAQVATNDVHPPLHYLLLHFWMALFGSGEAAVRSLSVLISVPVAAVTWTFGRRLVGAGPALFAALLVAASPSQVAAGQEARMYGLLTLTALLSWWALWAAAAAGNIHGDRGVIGSRKAWATYTVVTAAMLYSHYFGLFVVTSQVVYLVWLRPASAGAWRRRILGVLTAVLLFLPWLPALGLQLSGGRAWPEHRQPLSWNLPVDTLAAMTVGRPVIGPVTGPVGPGGVKVAPLDGDREPVRVTGALAFLGFAMALALAALGAVYRRIPWDARVLLLCAGLLPLAMALGASLVRNIYAPHYLLFIVPPVALLVAAGAAALAAGPKRLLRAAGLLLPVLVLVPNAAGTLAFYCQPRLDVFDWRLVSRTLAAQARPDDAIAFLPGFSRIPVNYYFRGPQPRVVLTPRGERDVEGPGGARLRQVADALAQHQRVWILTVPPVPPSVGVLVGALGERGFAVTRQEAINMARLILLERGAAR